MAHPKTLALIHPEGPCQVRIFKESDGKIRTRLHLSVNSVEHLFDVTDPAFSYNHQIRKRLEIEDRIEIAFNDPAEVAVCLSLTPPFHGYQYKIAASIIEL